jgi:hypothetical protein
MKPFAALSVSASAVNQHAHSMYIQSITISYGAKHFHSLSYLIRNVLQADCFTCHLLHAGSFLGLFFYPEDGGDTFLQNVNWLSTDYTIISQKIKLARYKPFILRDLKGAPK